MIKLISAVLGPAVLAAAGWLACPSEVEPQAARENSLSWFAQKAKSEGKDKVSIPAPFADHMGEEDDPDLVLSYAKMVVAQPVSNLTVAPSDDEIVTWYKFRTLETLSEGQPCLACPAVEPPAGLLPLNEDEFLIVKYGGTLLIEGVAVTMLNRGIPDFAENQKYLLMLLQRPSQVASLWAGPTGIFTVDANGAVEPVNKRPHPMKEVVKRRFGGAVGRLRRHLKGG